MYCSIWNCQSCGRQFGFPDNSSICLPRVDVHFKSQFIRVQSILVLAERLTSERLVKFFVALELASGHSLSHQLAGDDIDIRWGSSLDYHAIRGLWPRIELSTWETEGKYIFLSFEYIWPRHLRYWQSLFVRYKFREHRLMQMTLCSIACLVLWPLSLELPLWVAPLVSG